MEFEPFSPRATIELQNRLWKNFGHAARKKRQFETAMQCYTVYFQFHRTAGNAPKDDLVLIRRMSIFLDDEIESPIIHREWPVELIEEFRCAYEHGKSLLSKLPNEPKNKKQLSGNLKLIRDRLKDAGRLDEILGD